MLANKGFSLIEVVLAVFMITAGSLGIFALIQKNIILSSASSPRLTASYLAQEGIEIVRNIRDSNWLEQRLNLALAWDDGLPIGDWEADYQLNALTVAYTGTLLKIDSNNFYSYAAGQETLFQRKINITKPAGDKIVVSVEVSWQDRGSINKVSASSELYDWK